MIGWMAIYRGCWFHKWRRFNGKLMIDIDGHIIRFSLHRKNNTLFETGVVQALLFRIAFISYLSCLKQRIYIILNFFRKSNYISFCFKLSTAVMWSTVENIKGHSFPKMIPYQQPRQSVCSWPINSLRTMRKRCIYIILRQRQLKEENCLKIHSSLWNCSISWCHEEQTEYLIILLVTKLKWKNVNNK